MSLLEKTFNSPGMQRALEAAGDSRQPISITGVLGMSLMLFGLAFANDTRLPLMMIFPDEDRLYLFDTELHWLLEQESMSGIWQVASLPDFDAHEIEEPAMVKNKNSHRMRALTALYSDSGGIPWILATPGGALRNAMNRENFRKHTVCFDMGAEITPATAAERLVAAGYERKKIVKSPGRFCIRGGMIDVFPIQGDAPARIELAGDIIDEIRIFDPDTQRSSAKIESLTAAPCSETLAHLARGERDHLRKDHRHLAEHGMSFTESALYPTAFSAGENLLESGAVDRIIIVDETRCREAFAARREVMSLRLENNDFTDPEKVLDGIYSSEFDDILKNSGTVSLNPRPAAEQPGTVSLPVSSLPPLPLSLDAIAQSIRRDLKHGEVAVISKYKKRLDSFLAGEGIHNAEMFEGDIRGGIKITDIPFFIYTDSDMFQRPPPRKKKRAHAVAEKSRATIKTPDDISEGDYVVHVDHGVGIYKGIERQSSGDGYDRDFFRIMYGKGDALFVPVDQLSRIEKYIGAGASLPKIYPLNSKRWGNVKKKVQEKVDRFAAQLYYLYQERMNVRGYKFSGDNIFLHELAASFPYEETADQLTAIEDVYRDMEAEKPMDRLVYGDVGYGKTEVAVRAAFKAAVDKKQVAILAPTTILAHQHGETFRERLARFPVTVDVISRFKSRKEQKEIIARLASGELDVVIGTHRILSKDIKFKNLGLLIIDEEQRFGVKHKEKLKMMKTNMDVLTLTATPIPRTMNMSMLNLRDMSMISTPPEDRRAVMTFVEESNQQSLNIAIGRELARRGQVYFVHNVIETIGKVKENLEAAFPRARIATCHGKMPEKQIEQTMVDFYNGVHDILVSTTIIENGLDIPNVNTLIVEGAENFGLAQLYQLRGRVGRSYRQSYAYFFHGPRAFMNDKAKKRLEAISDFADLGSGYQLAMKDFEIRGAGNLLGREQHGYITEVGFHLYCRMLSDSVNKMRGIQEEPRKPLEVDFTVSAFIPEDYIAEMSERTSLYKKLVQCETIEEVEAVEAETTDRFGEPPLSLRRILKQAKIRVLANALGVAKIKTHPRSDSTDITFQTDEDRIRFHDGPYPIAVHAEIEHIGDITRLVHRGYNPDQVMDQFFFYFKFIYDELTEIAESE